MCILGILTLLNDDPRFKGLISNVGPDSLSNAKYAVLGGAARFFDAFDSQPDGSPVERRFNNAGGADDLEFIEAEQHVMNIDQIISSLMIDEMLPFDYYSQC